MKKRLLALILTIIMAVSCIPVSASAVEWVWGPFGAQTAFEAEYSREVYRPFPAESDYTTFTVPCKGQVIAVLLSAGVEATFNPTFKASLTGGGKTYHEEGHAPIKSGGWYLFRGELPAGKYTVKLRYASTINFSSTKYNGASYKIEWYFFCSHENTSVVETKAATCSETGEIQCICDDCEKPVKTTTTDKLPHTPDEEWATVQEPTCSAAGKRTQTCTVCGEVALEEAIDKLPHEAAWKTTKEATCAAPGRQDYICSVCGEIVETKSIPALDHTYGAWTTTKEGNCSTQGERQRECSVCGYIDKQKTDPDDDHNFGSWWTTVKATCDQPGKETRTCYLCNKEETRIIPQLDHEYGKWTVTTQATCSQEGTQYRVCKNCNDQETQTIPKLPHTNERVDLGVANGKKAYQDRCTVCGYTSKTYYEGSQPDQEVSVTRANSTTPTVIVLVVPAFTDVNSSSWYQSVVTYAYNLGLMVGNSDTTFNPMGNVTVAEAVTMAARARNSYEGGTNNDFKASSVWYQTYVDYAIENGIIKKDDFDRYDRVATRAEMAYIFAHALPDKGMKAINKVTSLPDVDSNTKYSKEIFTLYNAGILTGSDTKGTFLPDNPITRSEAAAIITRITLSSERKTLNLK